MQKSFYNPNLGDIKPSFMHFYSVNSAKNEARNTSITFCIKSTNSGSIEIFDNSELLFKEDIIPNNLYKQYLCISGRYETTHHGSLNVKMYDSDKKEFLNCSSDGVVDLCMIKVKVINSKQPYKQFKYKKIITKYDLSLIRKIYESLYLKFRYTQISIRRLFLITGKTFYSLIRYIFTSKLR